MNAQVIMRKKAVTNLNVKVQFQKIIILMRMKCIENVIIHVKVATNQEMIHIIIVIIVQPIINFLTILYQQKIIVMKIAFITIISRKIRNILAQHLIHVLLNIVN